MMIDLRLANQHSGCRYIQCSSTCIPWRPCRRRSYYFCFYFYSVHCVGCYNKYRVTLCIYCCVIYTVESRWTAADKSIYFILTCSSMLTWITSTFVDVRLASGTCKVNGRLKPQHGGNDYSRCKRLVNCNKLLILVELLQLNNNCVRVIHHYWDVHVCQQWKPEIRDYTVSTTSKPNVFFTTTLTLVNEFPQYLATTSAINT